MASPTGERRMGGVNQTHIEVLRRLHAALPTVGINGWLSGQAAITAAIESLSASPAEGAQSEDAARLDSGKIMLNTRDEFGETQRVLHKGLDLRAAIDRAIQAEGNKA